MFGFWVGQGLKLWRNTCFCPFNSSLVLNFHVPKPEKLALSKMWTSIICLLKGAHMTMTPGQSAWGFEYNFRCLKQFFRKVPKKLRSAFFLNWDFWKYGFWSRDWSAYVKVFLTNTVNFGIGSAFSIGLGSAFSKGPLFLKVKFIKYVIWWLTLEVYLEPSQKSTMELFFEKSLQLLKVNYFPKKAPSPSIRLVSKYASEYYNIFSLAFPS